MIKLITVPLYITQWLIKFTECLLCFAINRTGAYFLLLTLSI